MIVTKGTLNNCNINYYPYVQDALDKETPMDFSQPSQEQEVSCNSSADHGTVALDTLTVPGDEYKVNI